MIQPIQAQVKITHIAVYVSDLEQSADFYREVLHFKEIEEPFKDGLHAWFDIGNNVQLHIIEAEWQPITINKINHLCFSIPDMNDFLANLKRLNVAFEDWPGQQGKITIRPDGIQQIYLRDPDGYWIEINDEY
ncbi:lactoylglutathione lyase-like lyase [Belliella baltica DSM 15883]|uniref:Lactoylglutathione lyase-like lyase n=1 Tax=Belliella baltica (strain DSM 15883 / CIP 108006 / LMG 21964 / BA134) TaxID=866536 RepID=I3ZAR7_BELBD|nr:VOC family protein [Belliella baltica]AFL86335.1 lactoylglutathione lyase-like lyase [Belliella baltica DSM 15883]